MASIFVFVTIEVTAEGQNASIAVNQYARPAYEGRLPEHVGSVEEAQRVSAVLDDAIAFAKMINAGAS